MDSLLCDLVRALAKSSAHALRERAARQDLTRAEILGIAGLLELAGAVVEAQVAGARASEVPASSDSKQPDWAALEAAARAEVALVTSARSGRMPIAS